jgi:hypothetical protein
VLLGRHNCSGTATDRTCSGGTTPTSIDWDLDANPVPPNAGLAVEGVPGIIGATDPELIERFGVGGGLSGVEGLGSEQGGWFWGRNWGVLALAEQFGVEAQGGRVGVIAGGNIGVSADGREIGVVAIGDTAIEANGAVTFSSAGLVIVREGQRTARVGVDSGVGQGAKVLAMAQTQGGAVKRVLRSGNAITIVLAGPATQDMEVAYFVIS